MVSLRFCIDLRDTDLYSKSRLHKPAMRTGVWRWCAPPRRRRRRDPSPPPHPISLCPAPMEKPLTDFAESVADEAGLSDIDFSVIDESELQHAKSQNTTPRPMVMDAVSKKWMGNENEFERFHQIVADIGHDQHALPDQSAFQVSERQLSEWRQNGEEHNVWFKKGTKDQGVDIRNLTQRFSRHVERRKATS